jgi:hypothetical protein
VLLFPGGGGGFGRVEGGKVVDNVTARSLAPVWQVGKSTGTASSAWNSKPCRP